MWTVKLREPRILMVLGLLVAMALLVITLDFTTEVHIWPERLFSLPWGEAEGYVGFAESRGRIFGPRSFAVGEDRIYLADTFNSQVLVLSMDGQVLDRWDLRPHMSSQADARVPNILPGAILVSSDLVSSSDDVSGEAQSPRLAPWINDIALGPDGRIYLADIGVPRILVMNPDGTLDRHIDLTVTAPGSDPAGDAVWLMERLVVDDSGILYLSHAYLSDTTLARRVTRYQENSGKFAHISSVILQEEGGLQLESESLLPVPANSFTVDARGHIYVESTGPSPFTRVIRSYDSDIRPAHTWEITWPQLYDGSALIGVDSREWVYFALGTGRPEGKIVVLAPEQGKLYEARANWQDGYEVNIYARLHGNDLFVARPQDDGFAIERWPVQRVRRIVLSR